MGEAAALTGPEGGGSRGAETGTCEAACSEPSAGGGRWPLLVTTRPASFDAGLIATQLSAKKKKNAASGLPADRVLFAGRRRHEQPAAVLSEME